MSGKLKLHGPPGYIPGVESIPSKIKCFYFTTVVIINTINIINNNHRYLFLFFQYFIFSIPKIFSCICPGSKHKIGNKATILLDLYYPHYREPMSYIDII